MKKTLLPISIAILAIAFLNNAAFSSPTTDYATKDKNTQQQLQEKGAANTSPQED